MFSLNLKTLLVVVASMFLGGFAFGQCSVSIQANTLPGGDCNGVTVDFTATGDAVLPVLSNDFNLGVAGPGWASTGGAVFSQPCGPGIDNTPYYWASTSTGTPNLTTVGFDVACGGTITFDMVYSVQGGASPCEGPDLPDEGVTLQYSTNGGATWTVIDYWPPNGGYDPAMTAWSTYTLAIPAGAMTANTSFQWIQTNSSGTCCDNWGIDNVVIGAAVGCASFYYDWDNIAGSPDNQSQTVTATQTTTYTITYTDGTVLCTDSYTIVVPPGPTADAGPDLVYCPGSGPLTIGASPVSADNGATYSWTGGAGSGTINGGNNGQGSVSPAAATTYTVSVTDNGCTSTDDMTVTMDQAPTASNIPAVNVQCSGDVPPVNIADVFDEADDFTAAPVVTHVGDVSDNGTCPETITRTYRVTDGCGNFTDVTQIITIHDTQNPVFAAPPANLTVECSGDVPAMTNLGWTDNCDGNGTVLGADGPLVGGTCGGTVTRTWTYTDACGNVGTTTQTITVNDTQAPVFAAAPVDVAVECIGDVPAMTNLAWTDNCDGNGSVPGVDGGLVGGPCGGTITRTWTYTDACGNTATTTQTITVDDTTLPTASNPATTNVVQGNPVPPIDITVVIDEADNCTVNPMVTFISETSDNGFCPETITRVYRITDDCGNFIEVDHLITIADAIAPTATNPPNINVSCFVNVPAPDPLVVADEADNSGVPPTVDFVSDVSDGNSCPETITRTYSVTDDCGNMINVTQLIIIIPTAAPVIPANVTTIVECIADAVQPVPPVVSDECGNNIVPTVVIGADPICEGDKVFTYTYTDCAGNSSVFTYTYTLDVTTAPVVPANGSELVVCVEDIYIPTAPVVTDVCGNNIVPVMTQNADPVCVGDKVFTFTYTDCAGNASVYTYTFSVNDDVLPTASNPAPISVLGSMDVPAPDPLVVTDEADNCIGIVTVDWVSDVSDGNVCNGEIITRTYSVTDACGNQILVTQAITILAVYPPISAGPDTIVCVGDWATVNADNPWSMPIAWDNGVVDGTPWQPVATLLYTVTADNLGCISTDDMWVTMEDIPVVSFTADLMGGCAPIEITFTNTSTTTSSLDNCQWTVDGSPIAGDCSSAIYTFQSGGLYDIGLTTTSINGCTNSDQYDDFIFVEDVPQAAFDVSRSAVQSIDTEVEFFNNSVDASTYSWDFGDGTSSTAENPTHNFPEEPSGTYTVELFAYSPVYGCVDSAEMNIEVQELLLFYVPNTFTPDNDNYNQTFQPVFHSGYDPYDFELLIFNRWGEVIFESHNADIGWDGTYGTSSEGVVADGTYSWKIEFKTKYTDERKTVTGLVNLIR
jgi:gliding motility-associated-like protein